MLAVVGCGGSDTTKRDTGVGGSGGPGIDAGSGTVTVDQSVLNFGPIDVGATSTPKTVAVTVGVVATALNATVVGEGFAISATTCLPKQPVGTCTISVVFAPTKAGAASGTLNVATAQVALSGQGVPPGAFSLTPDVIPLGTVLVGATLPATVTIIPTGSVALTCVPSGADLTLTTQTCPTAGPVAAQCTYTFTFKAATPGQKNEAIVCSGGGKTAQTTVTANVVTPSVLAINPPTQAFTAKLGQAFAWTFNVSNGGGATTGNLAYAVAGTGFAITSNDCPPQLAGAASCKLQVTFTPAAVGVVTGSLTVTDATPGSTPGSAVLTGTGINSAVTIVPTTKDFATVEVGKSATAAFTMTNGGTSATGIIALTPSDPQFTVTSDLCSGHTLEVKAQCTFAIVFAPTSTGLKQAMINASQTSDDAVLATATVSGTGQAAPKPARLTMSPSYLDFGTTGVQVPAGPKVFTITNDGELATGPLSVVKNVSTSESAASQFSYTSPDCTGVALPAHGTCHVAVTFAPTIAGSASAVIIVTDGTASTASMTGGTTPDGTVTGIALGIPYLTVACTPVKLAAAIDPFDPEGTVVGDTEKVVCTVTNKEVTAGNTPQESGLITITPTSDTPATGTFAVGTTNNCTASLQPNTSCIFELVFSPLAKGITQGTISISSTNRAANNQRLSGLGLLPIEIEEWEVIGGTMGKKAVSNYDFGQVPQGGSSADAPMLTTISLRVFVRKQVGNLAISGSDLSWLSDPALSDFTLTPATTGGCAKIDSSVALKADSKTTPYCTASIAFTPQVKTAVTTTIKALGGNGISDTASLNGTGTGPLTIQPSPVTFDAVAAGSASIQPLTLTVCNHTTSATQQASMTITGANAADFAVVSDTVTNQSFVDCVKPTLRLAIPAGAAAGPISAKLTVKAVIAGVQETQTVDLVGSVVNGAALTVTASGQFADTAMTNYSAPVVYTVKNTGALRTDELYFDIPDQEITTSIYGDFFWKPSLHNTLGLAQGTCAPNETTGIGIRLNPDQSCTFNVWFMPNPELGAVQRTSVLVVSSPIGGRQVVTLTGKATPQFDIAQGSSAVTSVTIDPTAFNKNDGPTTDITLRNLGGVDLTVASDLKFEFVDGVGQTGSALFKRVLKTGTTCTTLGKAFSQSPRDYCIYTLRMVDNESPSVPGARSTTLEITNVSAANGTQKATVVVNGTAVAGPSLAFTAASLVDRDFGAIVYGTNSRALTFTLTNTGGMKADQITTRDIYVLDTDGNNKVWSQSSYGKAGDFVLSGCEPGTDASALAPAAACVISVTFHPTRCTSGTGCKTTPASIPASTHLAVVYPVNGTATTVTGANLFGGAIVNEDVPSIGDATAGLAPYDFGLVVTTTAAPSVKATLSVKNETADDFTVPAFTSAVITGVIDSSGLGLTAIDDEFTLGTSTATGFCKSDGTTTLAGGNNESCKVIVTWTPGTTPGTREVKVELGAASIDIIGRVPTMPKLVAISPLGTFEHPLDFGNALVNVASAAVVVTIQNQGERATDGDLNVVGASDETGGTDAVSATGCESQLAAGATCVLTAKVTPAATGAAASRPAVKIQLAKDDSELLAPDPVKTTVQALYATWTGKTAAKITRSPTDAKLDFDTPSTSGYGTPVLAGKSTTVTAYTTVDVTLTNTAATAVKTGPMTFQTDNDDFSVDLDTTNSTCLSATYAFDGLVGGAAGCVVRVIFSPTALMATPPSTGNLIIKSANAATVTIPLTGTPIPSLSVAATAASGNTFTAATATASAKLVFKSASVANVAGYPEQEFTFSKAVGSPPTGLLSTLIDSDQFKIITDECIGIALQEPVTGHPDWKTSCTVKVRFAPTSSSSTAKTATLTVTDPTSGTPADAAPVSLSGMANP